MKEEFEEKEESFEKFIAEVIKHKINDLERWALDGNFLISDFDFKEMLALSSKKINQYLSDNKTNDKACGDLLPPIEYDHEVWACGVTYSRSRDAREAETDIKNVYDLVYEAKRPEIFKNISGRLASYTKS